ncbi:MAG TPA: hypothetical protein DD473_04640 [Planctomycetaceae bacterium]|nr:hypothetical protein [Planctomycetaceae bacterium]
MTEDQKARREILDLLGQAELKLAGYSPLLMQNRLQRATDEAIAAADKIDGILSDESYETALAALQACQCINLIARLNELEVK